MTREVDRRRVLGHRGWEDWWGGRSEMGRVSLHHRPWLCVDGGLEKWDKMVLLLLALRYRLLLR